MHHFPRAYNPVCALCAQYVELETAKTDEAGRAVHEDCYAAHVAPRGPILLPTGRGLLALTICGPN